MRYILCLLLLPSLCGAVTLSDITTQEINSGQLNEKLRGLTTGKLDIKPRRIACHNDGFINIDSDTLYIDCTLNRIGIQETSPLGRLHIKSGDAGHTSVGAGTDDLVIESSGSTGMVLMGITNDLSRIAFSDPGANEAGEIRYDHSIDRMGFLTNSLVAISISSNQFVGVNTLNPEAPVHIIANSGGENIHLEENSGGENWRIGIDSNGSLDFNDETTFRVTFEDGGNVGIGIEDPEDLLHVQSGSAGSVTANGDADEVVIESAATGGITILTPNDEDGTIFFGDPDSAFVGQIRYDHTGNSLQFLTSAAEALILETDQDVHVHPPGGGTADADLEVSDGSTVGAGVIHASTIAAHSSRKIKSHISYLGNMELQQAYYDVKMLKPARFRYKRLNKITGKYEIDRTISMGRGLIFEDAPTSIRTAREAISLNARILNLEMTVQILMKKIEILETP